MKISHPEYIPEDRVWRIRRHDGALVGAFATKALAQRCIDTARFLR